MSVLVTWFRLVLLAVFAEAAWTHVRQRQRFRRVLNDLGVPAVASGAVLAADLAIFGLLIVQPGAGALAAVAYLVVVTAVIGMGLRGRTINDCGCSSRPERVTGLFFIRNAALVCSALPVMLLPPSSLSDPSFVIAAVLLIGSYALLRLIPRLAGTGIRQDLPSA